jgi:formyl-CoA transferase
MERPDLLQDERFSGGAERYANREALKQEIAGWTSQRTKQEAMRILGAGGVPASAVLDSVDLFSDPHLHERGFIHSVEHETRGTLTMLGWPARLSESEVPLKAAPLLGKHSDEVIAADLALSEQEIAALHDEGIIG